MSAARSTCSSCGATFLGLLSTCANCGAALTRDLPDLKIGDVVDGKYEIVSLLGVGGMGKVFKARHLHLNTFRTLKVMRKDLLADDTFRRRFVREAQAATLVKHTNVAVVHDFSTLPDGTYFMVSEFIQGVTLRQWSTQHGRFPVPLALDIAVQVLEGLDHIHRAGLLHRDISADNIMIYSGPDDQPIAKIIDLGVAKMVTGTPAADRTQIGLFVGNPRYSSPEQLGALPEGEEVDARADLYCFGVVMYEMLVGAPPFVSKTPHGYAVKHLTEPPPPLRQRVADLDVGPGLEAVLFKALEKNRQKRFSSAREFAAALKGFIVAPLLRTAEIELSPPRRVEEGPPPPAREPQAIPLTLAPGPSTREADAWKQAAAVDTRASLHEFLSAFPHGEYSSVAMARLDDLGTIEEIGRLADRADISALTRLAGKHPDSSEVGKAIRSALDRMASESLRDLDLPKTMYSPLESPVPATSANRTGVLPHTLVDSVSTRTPSSPETDAGRKPAEALLYRDHTPTAEAPLPSRRGPAVVVAVMLLVVALLAGYLMMTRGGETSTPSTTETTGGAPAATAPAAVTRGKVAINALPWGKVVSIRTAANDRNWAPTAQPFTPMFLELPEGDYEIEIMGPEGSGIQKATARVSAAGSASVLVPFRAVGSAEYFRRAGWSQ